MAEDEKRDCTTDEWKADFYSKGEILKSLYEEAFQDVMYQDIFGGLNVPCNLILNEEMPLNRVRYCDLDGYIEDYDTVFIYPQIFDSYCMRRKNPKFFEALKSFKCIVVDLDDVTSSNIHSAINRIAEMPIKPNYIVNSGNGLHLYFVFSEMHHMKASIGKMAHEDRGVEAYRCLTQNIIFQDVYDELLAIYKKIKDGMTSWYDDLPLKADHDNHLAQPIRLFGSRTKNPKIFTQMFKVTDEKHSFHEVSEIFGFELFVESELIEWDTISKQIKNYNNHRRAKAKKVLEKQKQTVVIESILTTHTDSSLPVIKASRSSRVKFDKDEFIKKVAADNLEYKQSPEYLYNQRAKAERELKALEKKPEKKTATPAQLKGRLSQYNQFRKMIWDTGEGGKRLKCLHVFWNTAHRFTLNEEKILHDYYEMAKHFKGLKHNNKLSDKQIDDIVTKPPNPYTNDKILKKIGIEIEYVRKQDESRKLAKLLKEAKRNQIIEIAAKVFSDNPNESFRRLTNILNAQGIDVSLKTVSSMIEIRNLKNGSHI